MKAVLLAGGLGTRFAEETETKPKPMIEVGGRPILWHVMKIYEWHGITDFVICLGYKGYVIKEFFRNYLLHNADVTFDLRKNSIVIHQGVSEPWSVTLIETGASTMVGGRIKRILPYVADEEAFCFTYGDGVGDVDITRTIEAHKTSGRLVTVTAVRPPGRFGAIRSEGDRVTGFMEKPEGDGGWINGGFFVASPKIGDWIEGDETVWEREPMEALAAKSELGVHFHDGFWQPMDTLRDRRHLEDLWATGVAPWKVWS